MSPFEAKVNLLYRPFEEIFPFFYFIYFKVCWHLALIPHLEINDSQLLRVQDF